MKNLRAVSQMQYRSLRERLRPSANDKEQATGWNDQTMLIGLMVPMIMMALNMTMFGVALPTLRDTFGIQAEVAAWLVTAYTLSYITFMPLYGRLGDGLGKRRLLLTGITIFVTGTAINLLATDLGLLIFGRTIQGIGAGAVNPLCIAIISERFPRGERGKALGTWNSVGPLAALGGPFLAGFLVDHLGWRTIFWPTLLVGLVALFAVRGRVPPMRRGFVQPGFLRTFDWGGVVLLGATTMMLVFYISSRPITGVEALRDWRFLVAALLFFGGFFVWERRQANPFVTLAIFADKNFSWASIGSMVRMFAMSGIGFLVPLYLADVKELSAASIGIIMMLHGGALLAPMGVGGLLADRWNSRWLVVIGSSVQMGMMVYLGLLPGTASLGLFVAGLIGHGLGAGISLAPLHRFAMSQIPPEQTGLASGLYNMIRFSGVLFGVALGGVLLQQGLDRALLPVGAYQVVFRFIAGIVLVGVVIGWRLRE